MHESINRRFFFHNVLDVELRPYRDPLDRACLFHYDLGERQHVLCEFTQ